MKNNIRFLATLVAISVLWTGRSLCFGDDLLPASDSDGLVTVHYASGGTELATLSEGVTYFTNHDAALRDVPPALIGLTFTRRSAGQPSGVEIDASAGAKVYLLVDGDTGRDAVPELNKQIALSGWSRIADIQRDPVCPMVVYERDFASEKTVSLDGPGWSGFVVVAKNLEMKRPPNESAPPDSATDSPTKTSDQPQNASLQSAGTTGPAIQIAKLQSEIKALEVLEQDDGIELGEATDLILTADPGSKSGEIPVSFASEVGSQTKLVLDELIRWTHVNFPKISGTDKIEFSFEDKYEKHDGGSIGAACGTLILSALQGFDIDPNIAMTGDVSADGKVRAIGGVAAKLRGAAVAGCTLVALPEENYEQLVDAEIYDGLPAVTNTQVLGISTLDSAAAVARVDRDSKLAQAIDLFSQIQQSIKQSPDYLQTAKAQDDLHQVLDLAPNHLSAKVLLSIAQGTARTRLTAGASIYYTLVAVQFALPMINQQIQSGTKSPVLPAMVDESLNRLRLVHQRSDPHILPLIDAWQDWIQASSDYESGNASDDYLEGKRLAVQDAMTKLQANRELIEKILHEGM
jgi:hypothetical protein